MNKAFIKEPEDSPPQCPGEDCRSAGVPVSFTTLTSQLSTEAVAAFSSNAFFCPRSGCDVVYFDAWGQSVLRNAVTGLPHPKDPDGPICSCLGIAAADIIAEARVGRKDAALHILEHLRKASPDCESRSVEGRSCERALRALLAKHLKPAG